mmetsp:Transcript_28278/g.55149  ORF Transcript_28278/g.55149 Transcript_28278/m.55149 type:complete len:97 (+) Transcript_28278:434-724(+)
MSGSMNVEGSRMVQGSPPPMYRSAGEVMVGRTSFGGYADGGRYADGGQFRSSEGGQYRSDGGGYRVVQQSSFQQGPVSGGSTHAREYDNYVDRPNN